MMKEILNAREARYNQVVELLSKYSHPVICGKINYPGEIKNTRESSLAFEELKKLLMDKFGNYIVFDKINEGYDGNSIVLVVDMNYLKAKEIGVDIEENHKLGRLFDIDIYIENGKPISRDTVSKEKRKCIVCGKDARMCIKGRNHSIDEVIRVTNDFINKYFI